MEVVALEYFKNTKNIINNKSKEEFYSYIRGDNENMLATPILPWLIYSINSLG